MLADGCSHTDAGQAGAYYTFLIDLARNRVSYELFAQAVSLMKQERWFERYAAWFELVGVQARLEAYQKMQGNPDIYPAPVLEDIRCPALVIFGDQDVNVDVRESAEAYTTRLKQALQRDVTIKVYPGTDHHICIATQDGESVFAPGYFQLMGEWLYVILWRECICAKENKYE